MVVEFAIGFATIFWIAPTLAAFAGFAMSVGLWTAATWHVTPYFLASDTAYAVLWLVYFLTLLGTRRRIDVALDRRGAMRIALLAFASVGAALIGNIGFKTPSKVKNLQLTPSASGTSGGGSGAATQNQIIKLADLPVGKSYEFASADGLPAIVFRTKNGVFAYSEICTHQGCTVSYVPAYKALICPCHGATYDAFNGAAVIGGPAPAPLAPVKVAISGDWVVQA